MNETILAARVTADIADFNKKFSEMRSSLDRLANDDAGTKQVTQLQGVREEVSKIGALLKSGAFIAGGAALTAGITVPIIDLGREAVMMADKLRQSEIAFGVMLGSAQKATDFLRDLQAFAARTPFEFPDLQESAKRMLALGFSAEKIIPTLTNVGNAVSAVGGNAGTFNRILLAMGQIQSKGQLMTQEMRQLAEAGIPAWQILADTLGITVKQAMERVEAKAVDGATAIAALQSGMAARFGGLMEQQAQTIEGTLANLKDTVGFIMTDIGREIIETLKLRDVLATVQSFTKGFLDWFRQLDSGTKQVLMVFTGTFAAGGPILVAVGAFMAAMAVVTTPLLVGGAIVAGLVAGVTLILLNWQKIKDTGISLWTSLTTAVKNVIEQMVVRIEQTFARLGQILSNVRQKTEEVAGFFKRLYDVVSGHSYVPDMVDSIEHHMQRLGSSAMVDPVFAATLETGNAFRLLQGIGEQGAKNTVDTVEQHMRKLDVALGAPGRRAAISIENVFRGINVTSADLLEDLRERSSFTAGAMVQNLSGAFAGALQGTANWSQMGQELLNQFLTNAISMVLTWTTTWLAGEALRVATTQGANAAILASTTAVSTAMVALFSTVMGAIKAVALGLARTMVSVVSTVVAGVSVVLNTISVIIGFVLATVGKMLIAIGSALQSIPIIGTILGAIMIGLGALTMGAGLALPGIIAGITAGLAAGVGAFAGAIPAFAQGGAVFGPTLALVGEKASRHNPEYIGHANQLGLGGPIREQTIILTLDGHELMRYVTNKLIPHLRLRQVPI